MIKTKLLTELTSLIRLSSHLLPVQRVSRQLWRKQQKSRPDRHPKRERDKAQT